MIGMQAWYWVITFSLGNYLFFGWLPFLGQKLMVLWMIWKSTFMYCIWCMLRQSGGVLIGRRLFFIRHFPVCCRTWLLIHLPTNPFGYTFCRLEYIVQPDDGFSNVLITSLIPRSKIILLLLRLIISPKRCLWLQADSRHPFTAFFTLFRTTLWSSIVQSCTAGIFRPNAPKRRFNWLK